MNLKNTLILNYKCNANFKSLELLYLFGNTSRVDVIGDYRFQSSVKQGHCFSRTRFMVSRFNG